MEAVKTQDEAVRDLLKATKSRLPVKTYSIRNFCSWRWKGQSKDGKVGGVLEDQYELWNAIGDLVNGKIDNLYLYGVPGVGKTHLALAIGWNRCVQGGQVIFYQIEVMLDELRASYKTGDYSELWETLKDCDLLILDDLGTQKDTEWASPKLDALIDYRYVEGKQTIITANTLEVPPRILDRCKEGKIVQIKGESHRGK